MKKKIVVKLQLCEWLDGYFIYINNHRISGGKPRGTMTELRSWMVDIEEIKEAIGIKQKARAKRKAKT